MMVRIDKLIANTENVNHVSIQAFKELLLKVKEMELRIEGLDPKWSESELNGDEGEV